MNTAIKICFTKYFDPTGRASRKEFWYFYLFTLIGDLIIAVINPKGSFVDYLFLILVIPPLINAEIRRLHDVSKSGWYLFVPLYNLYLLVQPPTPEANKYGDSAPEIF